MIGSTRRTNRVFWLRGWVLAVVGLIFAGVGCGAGAPPRSQGSAVATPAVEKSAQRSSPTLPRAEEKDPEQAFWEGPVGEIFRRVSILRGLEPKAAVRSRFVQRSEAKRMLVEQIHETTPPNAIRGSQDFLLALGLIPPGYDLEAGMMRVLEANLEGFYDPKRKTMFLLSDVNPEVVESDVAHELVHALQDQYYDLERLTRYRPGAGDELTALHCLAEGDATAAMILYTVVRKRGLSGIDPGKPLLSPKVLSASLRAEASLQGPAEPRILGASLVSTYIDGYAMVSALLERGGWEMVDRAWKDPPKTTEQVLHVKKWFAREPAEKLGIPGPPNARAGLRLVDSDVMGEQGLRLVMEQWLGSRRDAARAAAGWGGDRMAVYEPAGRGAPWMAWRIRFDRGGGEKRVDAEAVEAWQALKSAGVGALERPAALGGGEMMCWEVAGGRRVLWAGRRGREILMVGIPVAGVSAGKSGKRDACRQAEKWAGELPPWTTNK